MSPSAVALAECPNCGRALDGNYCAGCGQKVAPVNPTLADVLHDFMHEALNVDGKTLRSTRLLFAKPGFLTHEYFEGKRARYVSPIRLYLIFSVIYFGIAALAPQTAADVVKVKVTDADAEELRRRGLESEEELERVVGAAINTWAPRAMFVLVPLFALLVKAVTRGSGRNYPQHLYFALHLHAAGFALLTLGMLARFIRLPYVGQVVGFVMMVALVSYGVLAFRRAYGGTTARALLRTSVVGVGYVIAVGLAIAAMIIPIIRRVFL